MCEADKGEIFLIENPDFTCICLHIVICHYCDLDVEDSRSKLVQKWH